MDTSRFKWHFTRNVLLAIFFVMIFASLSAAAEARMGAIAATQASRQQQNQTAAAMTGGGGAGYDLRAISSQKKQPQTFTGFPAGTLPGDAAGGGGGPAEPIPKVALSGEPLAPAIGPEMVGSKLNRLSVIADRVGYSIVRMSYSPTVMDTPYTFALMNGNRKISTLYFNRSMTLVMVE